jgi:CRP-like cAMP-binding protein
MAEKKDNHEEELLFQILTHISPISLGLRNQISIFLKVERHPKKHILVRQGEVSRKAYFIVKGYTRSYFYDGDNREHTLRFSGQMDIMISVYSFFTQQPATESIEILENTTLLSMTWDQIQTLYGEYPEFNYHGRLLTEKYYIQSEMRALIIRTKRPINRYKLFLKYYPDVLKKATLGQIASFIGVTQETLSRIRSLKKF